MESRVTQSNIHLFGVPGGTVEQIGKYNIQRGNG